MFVKISTLLWVFRKEPPRVSPDRLRRFIRVCADDMIDSKTEVGIYNTITIGEWCLFWNGTQLIIGQVLCFEYVIPGKRNRPYPLDTVPINSSNNSKDLGIICSWYERTIGTNLTQIEIFEPISIENYAGHLKVFYSNKHDIKMDAESFNFFEEVKQDTMIPMEVNI